MSEPKTMTDAAGNSVPVQYVKPYDKRRDRIARRVLARFLKAREFLAKVKADTLADVEELQTFGLDAGALKPSKDNYQFSSFDGLIRVQLSAKLFMEFDERFKQAEALINEYLNEITDAANSKDISIIIKEAFRASASGMLSRNRVMALQRLDIKHPKWVKAMEIIRESQYAKGGKTYIYCASKESRDADFDNILLDLAAID